LGDFGLGSGLDGQRVVTLEAPVPLGIADFFTQRALAVCVIAACFQFVLRPNSVEEVGHSEVLGQRGVGVLLGPKKGLKRFDDGPLASPRLSHDFSGKRTLVHTLDALGQQALHHFGGMIE